MSMRSRINGFTAWVNLRLQENDNMLNNVIVDLMTGMYMKRLVESLTGHEFSKIGSFDNITQQQKATRAEWILNELKRWKVVPSDMTLDYKMIAAKSPDQVFELLWQLITHDIWFVWERSEFLAHPDQSTLCQAEFQWIAEVQEEKKVTKKFKVKTNFLAGFGSAAKSYTEVPEEIDPNAEPEPEFDPFPGSDMMKSFKKTKLPKSVWNYPEPSECILEMIQTQMQKTSEGRMLHITSLEEMADVRALCAFANSFIHNAFNKEVLLNDRWSINLILRALEDIFYAKSTFDSEDLAEGDSRAIAGYFCFLFLTGFRFRQCKAVVQQIEQFERANRDHRIDLERLEKLGNRDRDQAADILKSIDGNRAVIDELSQRFDVRKCKKWVNHANDVLTRTHKTIKTKMGDRFDVVEVPRSMTISSMCWSLMINLSLSSGAAFYHLHGKETIFDNRRIVLRRKKNGEFIDDYTGKSKVPVRKVLNLKLKDFVEIESDQYPQFDIFLESTSKNKQLEAGSKLLYQVFPGTTEPFQRILLKATKEGDFNTVEKLISFFDERGFINCRERISGNTALHLAANRGYFRLTQFLLEQHANIDSQNGAKCTPLFLAIDGSQKRISHLLIEWGCNIHLKNLRGRTAFETCRSEDTKAEMIQHYEFYSTHMPPITDGDVKALAKLIRDHRLEYHQLCNLRSRCLNGSTVMHTAAFFADLDIMKELLQLQLDVNLRDYKGASPLHRAKGVTSMRFLIENGARIDSRDLDGNQPLHVKCYGESSADESESSSVDLESINLLLDEGAEISVRNFRELMPIHCAAMQGRIEVIELLLKRDVDNEIMRSLESELDTNPPSLVHLSLANNCLDCAEWLMERNIGLLKPGESDSMIYRIVTAKLKLSRRIEVTKFLIDRCGAEVNIRCTGGNSPLHFAAALPDSSDLVVLLLDNGADVHALNNEHCSPLFGACEANNQLCASLLLEAGANIRAKNNQGLTALDLISDYEDWIDTGYFAEDVCARFRAFSLKNTRDLIRALSRKVKPAPPRANQVEVIADRIGSVLKACGESPDIMSQPPSPSPSPSFVYYNSGPARRVHTGHPQYRRRPITTLGRPHTQARYVRSAPARAQRQSLFL